MISNIDKLWSHTVHKCYVAVNTQSAVSATLPESVRHKICSP